MKVIENENEYVKALIRIEYLMSKGSKGNLNEVEQEELNSLGYLADKYEDENYPYPPVD